jgi:transposase-like protein
VAKRKRFSEEEIINKLRQGEVMFGQGKRVEEVCRQLAVSNQTFYKWRRKYGGMEVPQAKKLKELERENSRLKRLVADQALDNVMLKDLLSGKF